MSWDDHPYSHVLIDVENAVADDVTLHYGMAERTSGSLKIEITALTPLLVGHDRFAVTELRRGELPTVLGGICKGDKSLLLPWRAKWLDNQPVVLPAPSIKGMVRAALGQLLASPMERVAESEMSFQPNIGDLNISPRLHRASGEVINLEVNDAEELRELTICWAEPRTPGSTAMSLVVSRATLDQFNRSAKLPRNIEQCAKLRALDIGQFIHFEAEFTAGGVRVISIGRVKNYHLAQADTIRTRLIYSEGGWQRQARAEISPLKGEGLGNGDPKTGAPPVHPQGKLSGVRGVLGYVNMRRTDGHGDLNLGEDDLGRLAGRLAFYHALEYVTGNPGGSEAQRFLNPEFKYWVALRELAQGHATWAEAVLRPQGVLVPNEVSLTRGKNDLHGTTWTYGDHWYVDAMGDGRVENQSDALAGRRVHLHQGSVNKHHGHFDGLALFTLQSLEDEVLKWRAAQANKKRYILTPALLNNERATLARYVSVKGSKFRCTLNVQDLRDWEWGALLAIFNTREWQENLLARFAENEFALGKRFPRTGAVLTSYANGDSVPAFKLGNARSFGLGSISIGLGEGSMAGNECLSEEFRRKSFEALWKKLTKADAATNAHEPAVAGAEKVNVNVTALDERLAAWWRLRRYRESDRCLKYPNAAAHQQVLKRHAAARQSGQVGTAIDMAPPLAARQ